MQHHARSPSTYLLSTKVQMGDIVVKLPLPPGAATTLWKDDERYVKSYLSRHKGFYETADAGYKVFCCHVSLLADREG